MVLEFFECNAASLLIEGVSWHLPDSLTDNDPCIRTNRGVTIHTTPSLAEIEQVTNDYLLYNEDLTTTSESTEPQ